MAAVMQDDLKAILKDNAVPADIVDWMEKNDILTVKNLGNICDKPEQVGDRLVAATGKYVDDAADAAAKRKFNSVTAKVEQAWREDMAQVERHVKRTVDGLPSEPMDEPLGDTAKEMLNNTFFAMDAFDLETYLRPSDQLLGRVRREFEKQTPQFYPLSKVRSVHTQTRTEEPKKHKASA